MVFIGRLGFGVMEACRPLPFSEKKPNYIKTIWSAIKDAVFASQKKQRMKASKNRFRKGIKCRNLS
ncbi:hypothetical protein FA592_14230 (plasmid) [Sulfurospirillum diekertiae]|uniref:hypothetical protein n=1 Tax=Sulfurospirillum diekertiae TaxID=1854492 RepID=UPI0014319500|nr:hypothetical protein [Sulfurospirillum diekertiae]QNT10509.1 hypothetical protein FA592_14230 [Sulfurospirillum diekertiae]